MAAPAAEARRVQSQAPSVSAISVEHLSLVYPGRHAGQTVVALDDVSLDVVPGEFVCLLGPSGCGKSTLLNIIGGLLPYQTGAVKIGDRIVSGPSPHDVAFVFQE